MDSWDGRSSDPIILHKYLYANADGVSHTDPSGHMSLGDVSFASSFQSTLNMTTTVLRGAQFLHKVDTTLNFIYTAQEIGQLIASSNLSKDNRATIKSSASILDDRLLSEATDSLLRYTPPLTTWSLAEWAGYFAMHGMDHYLLHDDRNSSKDARYMIDNPFHYHVERVPKR